MKRISNAHSGWVKSVKTFNTQLNYTNYVYNYKHGSFAQYPFL